MRSTQVKLQLAVILFLPRGKLTQEGGGNICLRRFEWPCPHYVWSLLSPAVFSESLINPGTYVESWRGPPICASTPLKTRKGGDRYCGGLMPSIPSHTQWIPSPFCHFAGLPCWCPLSPSSPSPPMWFVILAPSPAPALPLWPNSLAELLADQTLAWLLIPLAGFP